MTFAAMDASQPALLVEEQSDRVIATLHRPEKRNAIDQALIDEIHALCEKLEAEPRTLIITGSGGTFAAGADIAQLRDRGAEEALKGINTHAFIRVRQLPMPVIAVVDGYALGGGAELAYAADIRIGTPSTKVGNPETALGIIAPAGATWRLREIIGEPLVAEVLLTGRILDAQECLASGLITHLEAPDAAMSRAHETADRIARLSAAATQAMKRMMLAPASAHPEADLQEQSVLFESADKHERMTAFLERKAKR